MLRADSVPSGPASAAVTNEQLRAAARLVWGRGGEALERTVQNKDALKRLLLRKGRVSRLATYTTGRFCCVLYMHS